MAAYLFPHLSLQKWCVVLRYGPISVAQWKFLGDEGYCLLHEVRPKKGTLGVKATLYNLRLILGCIHKKEKNFF